jgi:hypothetical protein
MVLVEIVIELVKKSFNASYVGMTIVEFAQF